MSAKAKKKKIPAYRPGTLAREVEKNIPGQLPLPCCVPKVEWQMPSIADLPSWDNAARVAVDLETEDPDLTTLGPGVRRDGKIIGIGIAIEDGPRFYLPVGHLSDNLPQEHVYDYVRDNARRFRGHIVGANLSYDLDYLWQESILFPNIKGYLDIQVAEPLIDDLQHSYSMQNISTRYGLPGKNEEMLRAAAAAYYVDPKKGMSQLPGRFAAAYGGDDAQLPLTILRRQERKLEEQNLGNIFSLECRLLPALVEMRRRGVRVDQKRLDFVETHALQKEKAALTAVNEISGRTLSMKDVNCAAALETVLKTIANIKIKETATGQPNIDKFLLASLKHPLADAISEARKWDKIRNTFVESVRRFQIKGRIHATFNQLRCTQDTASGGDDKGARYGRISMTDPNLQQQPSQDAIYDKKKEMNLLGPDDVHLGKFWRSIYVPDEGMIWGALDYSGQEPRVTVHYAADKGCTGGMEMADLWCKDPGMDLHKRTAELTGLPRKRAKIIFLGRCYGMGGAKFARDMGLPTEWKMNTYLGKMIEVAGPEAQGILNQFDQMVPFAKELARMAQGQASRIGYVTTLLGRRCRFPLKRQKDGSLGPDYDWGNKALNRIVQGSAADQTKMAVVLAYEAGHPIQLQVHDEIDGSFRDRAHAEETAEIMRTCVKLRVPSKVDVEVGDSWGGSMG